MSPLSFEFKLFVLLVASTSIVSAFKCKICDSTEAKCASDANSLEDKDCPNENAAACYILADDNGAISRGCVDDKVTCLGKNCVPCTDKEGCNTKTPFICKACDSSQDANCAQWKNENLIGSQICDDGISNCLVQINGQNTERRCALKDETCGKDQICNICNTANCNKGIFPTDRRLCYQCEADSKCGNPLANTDDIKSSACTLYNADEKCFVWGDSEKNMARGCSSDKVEFDKCSPLGEKCVQCDTNNCNVATYNVKQSIKCIQCLQSDPNCAWGLDASTAKDCKNQLLYWESEGCYTNKISTSAVERGCIHDTDLNCASGSTCTSCNSGSGCNNADAMEYTCYKCRSDDTPACADAAKDGKDPGYNFSKCKNPVTQAYQGCYTERWGNIIIRSCLVDADSKTRKQCADPNYKACSLCQEPNCNKDAPPNGAGSATLTGGFLLLSWIVVRLL